jgi:hypothetical protein
MHFVDVSMEFLPGLLPSARLWVSGRSRKMRKKPRSSPSFGQGREIVSMTDPSRRGTRSVENWKKLEGRRKIESAPEDPDVGQLPYGMDCGSRGTAERRFVSMFGEGWSVL